MIKEYKIPTLIGLVLLSIGLIAGVFLVQQGQIFFLRAAPELAPSEVKITNVADTSFVVSWTTDKETSGFVKYGETQSLNLTGLDERDQGTTGSYFTHYVILKNLKPSTQYFFKINSGGKTFDDSGNPYELTTAQSPNGAGVSDITSGKILGSAGAGIQGAIVYLSTTGLTPQSALSVKDGSWIIPLGMALSSNLNGYGTYDKQNQPLNIFVQAGQTGQANAMTTTANDSPIPDITLGKTLDFRQTSNTGSVTPAAQEQTNQVSKFSFSDLNPPTASADTATLDFINPTQEGEAINTSKPDFKGTGPAGKTIQITVESTTPYTGVVVVDQSGNWNWQPPADLAPGEHKITISYLGKTLTRSFVVLAAGESSLPAFTATPSGNTTTPTPTPTMSQSPTPDVTSTITPTVTQAPTPTTVNLQTNSSTTSATPNAGYLTTTFLVFIIGLGLVLSGFVTKKLLAHAR
ncbi:MAG: fibronectin type III domain-containing protein [bacterium]|nr:fibronectin type III domain-containing protein [bacterium]